MSAQSYGFPGQTNFPCPNCGQLGWHVCASYQPFKPWRFPHKCPVCDGYALIPKVQANNGAPPLVAVYGADDKIELVTCQACEKGIVWG